MIGQKWKQGSEIWKTWEQLGRMVSLVKHITINKTDFAVDFAFYSS